MTEDVQTLVTVWAIVALALTMAFMLDPLEGYRPATVLLMMFLWPLMPAAWVVLHLPAAWVVLHLPAVVRWLFTKQ